MAVMQTGLLHGAEGVFSQVKVLQQEQNVDNTSFNQYTVRNVSDRAREEAAAKIQKVLIKMLQMAPPPSPTKQVTGNHQDSLDAAFQREVQLLMQLLQTSRRKADSPKIVAVLSRLKKMRMSVAVLKKTKIAAELNQPCWQSPEIPDEARKIASALIREWRTLYRTETGRDPYGLPAAALARRSWSLSMDLEESIYQHTPRLSQHSEAVDELCLKLQDQKCIQGLMGEGLTTKELAKQVVGTVKRRQDQKRRVKPRLQ
mmetsp:Transcript_73555/g.207756  ORF Transcript_73555/g.207756 Transcript_73555/m.207756 type:complete len:258 (-) Transcript_73555:105-878(-)